MTDISQTIDITEVTGLAEADDLIELAAGRFEACAQHRGPHADGPCAECGWLAADHTAGLAVVVAVTRNADTAPLRRAS